MFKVYIIKDKKNRTLETNETHSIGEALLKYNIEKENI